MSKLGVVGSGQAGKALADGLLAHGHEVMRASRTPDKLKEWKEGAGPNAQIGTPAQAAQFGDMLILAVKGAVAEGVLELCGIDNLAGKVVIDPTNPIAEAPPDNGVLRFFTNLDESLMERLQRKAPSAHFVKAFSSVGNAMMVDPDFGGVKPTMFICGDDAAAKSKVSAILDQFGWEVADMGGVEAARAIEPLCMLWCIPGFLNNQWTHAFKLLQK
jgi:predicted dinucleotide-binding enzyme